jgi:hypothetical protein
MFRLSICIGILLALMSTAGGQEPFEGETLISPINIHNSQLLDMDGMILKTWHGGSRPASMAYMFPDGSILRPCIDPAGQFQAGGAGGWIQWIDIDDAVIWDFYFSNHDHQQHHDVEPLPNGNVLLIAWERKSREEAIAQGRQSINGEMWPTLIVEVEPVGSTGGNIVWEWHLWDHLIQDVDPEKPNYGVVAEHPELMDINFGNIPPAGGDWIHANAIDYHEQFDQIVFTSRKTNEIYVIDHSTTTEEAAGHTGGNSGMGGDILYRWGNPQAYDRGTGEDQYFYVAHGGNWIDPGLPGEGDILVFNNGDRPGGANDYSDVAEIAPPVDENGHYHIAPDSAFGPSAPIWVHGGPGTFDGGATQCGAYRLPNGNTLITLSRGYIFEVTESGTTVWDYDHPDGSIARAERYWEESSSVALDMGLGSQAPLRLVPSFPNPFLGSTQLGLVLAEEARVRVEIFSISGRRVTVLLDGHCNAKETRMTWDGRDAGGLSLASGTYFMRVVAGKQTAAQRVVLLE